MRCSSSVDDDEMESWIIDPLYTIGTLEAKGESGGPAPVLTAEKEKETRVSGPNVDEIAGGDPGR